MKKLQILGLFLFAACLAGCKTAGTTGGNQEAKRRAAIAQQQHLRGDESDENLRSAQDNILKRDNNPALKP